RGARLLAPAAPPCTGLSRAPSPLSGSGVQRRVCRPSDIHSFGILGLRIEPRPKTMLDLSGSLTLPFLDVPCSQTPPRSLTTSPSAVAYCCLPGIRPCRPADDISRGSIASLALRPAPRSAYA